MNPSLWEKESFLSPADILIAGSGFVGLWSAYHLKKKNPRLRITVIDRGYIPTGASTRNAGFACFGSVTELIKDSFTMGDDNMLTLVEMRHRGLEKITNTFRKKQIDYTNVGGYELIPAIQKDKYSELKDQVKWLNKLLRGVTNVKKTFSFADEKIKQFGFAEVGHIIFNELEGYLHPGKLCQQLMLKVQAMGVNIVPATEITHHESKADGITVHTNRNFSLRGERLLICTNGFAKQLLPDLEIVPARGQVLVTAPLPSLKFKGTFHYDEGYYYFRNLGNRILIGGARNLAVDEETTTALDTTSLIQETLENFISRHLLPRTPFKITDRWSGIMGLGAEKMPIIKKLNDRLFCAVKMSGMGVALAPVAGEQIASMMND